MEMEWKKIASMEFGKIVFHSIPYHALVAGRQQRRDPLYPGVEINLFNNLPAGQAISNVYLPEKISTCPKKIVMIT